MKGVVIAAIVFCVALISLGVFFSSHSTSNGSRITDMNQQYLDRQANNGWVRGATKPTVTLEEFADYQCPGCAALAPVITQALAQTANFVQFTFREYPLPKHNKARLASEAAEAAGRQGKYWEMHDFLFNTQPTWVNYSLSDFTKYVEAEAQAFGINLTQFQNDMGDSSEDTEVNKDISAGNDLAIVQTPSLIINGKLIDHIPSTTPDMVALLNASVPTPTPTP